MRPGRREVAAWCLFDFANSSFTTVIVTTVFSVYFVRSVVAGADSSLRGETLWSWANSGSLIISAILAPLLGALADSRALRRAFLITTSLLCIGATALLATVRPGDVALAMALFVVANVGFELGYVFYNGFLPDVARPGSEGRVSGYGWAAGYIGGLLSLALSLVPLKLLLPADADAAQSEAAARTCFLIVAAHFLLFASPAFLLLRDRPLASRPPLDLLAPFRQVFNTLRGARRYSEAFTFILASLIYNDGLVTIFAFAGIYMADVLKFSQAEIVLMVLVLNLPSAGGAFLSGFVSDRLGAKPTILLTIALLAGSVFAMALTAPGQDASADTIASARAAFWVVAMIVGLGVGANQAASRALMARLVPEGRQGEFFGFFIFSSKLASVVAPLTYGLVVQLTGSSVLAILSVTVFLVAGGVLLLGVDVERGLRQAAAPLDS